MRVIAASEIAGYRGASFRKGCSPMLVRSVHDADQNFAELIDAIALHCAGLPTYHDRSPDEIVGYDERGMW